MTRIPPFSFEGCASRVPTLCITFAKGRDYKLNISTVHDKSQGLTYCEFLNNANSPLNRRSLKGEHRVFPLDEGVSMGSSLLEIHLRKEPIGFYGLYRRLCSSSP